MYGMEWDGMGCELSKVGFLQILGTFCLRVCGTLDSG